MLEHQKVWIKDVTAIYALPVFSPCAWTGEADCAVGPFSSRDVAECFVTLTTTWQQDVLNSHIFVSGDSWYVEVPKS